MNYYIGLAQWHHADWYDTGKNSQDSLSIYQQHFSSVEGNNTFYGLPSTASINAWCKISSEPFKFCFKFPKVISHEASLQHCNSQVSEFLQLIAPLESRLGLIWLQMPKSFSPEQLGVLRDFLVTLPREFNYGIEVRHLEFFNKGATEKEFNQLLSQYNVNRVIFDTRTLFANPADDEATQDGLRKKPRVPTHVLATANFPMVRFISPMDTQLAETALDQWARKTIQWIDEGKTPYIFFHTPDNKKVPQLAERFARKVNLLRPEIPTVSLWSQQPQQNDLF
ncbi:MAG TPA: DUF72 domain-containing protein [Leucothrix mucor]|nr:DUF72 domain-containing protein [Leucothrix mucor]